MKKTAPRLLLLVLAAGIVPACHDGGGGGPLPASYTQVERLARPAVNEGLFTTNDFLNAVNSITPAQEPGALVGAVGAEAIGTLDAVDLLAGDNDDVDAEDVVAALIPDVMRIDTTLAIPPGTGAYATGAVLIDGSVPANGVSFPRPVAGRKIEDDVIDITLSLLVDGDGSLGAFPAVKDNAEYVGVPGNAAQPGHSLLNGQVAPLGAATFPFLAAPN